MEEDLYLHAFIEGKDGFGKCMYCGQHDYDASLYCEEAEEKPTFESSVKQALTESAFDRMDRQFKK
jgi:hypothetical protein